MTDRLRLHWDFDDLEATERRLRTALAEEASSEGRAEALTQLARAEGLRGDYDTGEKLVREAGELAGASEVVAARSDLERGAAPAVERRPGGGVPPVRIRVRERARRRRVVRRRGRSTHGGAGRAEPR